MARDDEDLSAGGCYLRGAAAAGQSDLGPIVGADDRCVDVAVAVNLGDAQEPYRDTPSLKPVVEDLDDRDCRNRGVAQLSVAYGQG
jgi:hypothetical protein